ncbi:MAG: hypothetical protein NPIRA01_30800 [Nitrospirales bacterium]|nr:MAG: hypothetical protein NPIRA01_30800 [Nitrospirales bacterium]
MQTWSVNKVSFSKAKFVKRRSSLVTCVKLSLFFTKDKRRFTLACRSAPGRHSQEATMAESAQRAGTSNELL